MRLGVAALCALLVTAAAQPDIEDLPPVDELVDRLITGEMQPQQLVEMALHVPHQYLQDVKHNLPDELKQQIGELMHSQHVEPQPVVEEEEDYTDGYEDEEADDYEEDYADEPDEVLQAEEETPEEAVEEEEAPAEDGEEPVEEEVEEEVIQPEHTDGFRAQPRLRGGTLEDSGVGGGGSGSGTGGVLPGIGAETPLDDVSAIRKLFEYSQKEREGCTQRYNDAYSFYADDHTMGTNKVSSEVSYMKLWREFAEDSSQYDLSGLDRTDLVNAFMLLGNAGPAALDDTQLNELATAITNLETKFANAKVCDFFDESNCDLRLYQDIRVKLASSTNWDELAHYWHSWRGLVGRDSGKMYADYVKLLDTAAKKKSPDWTAWSLLTYPYRHGNTPTLLSDLERLWEQQISPLYDQLHTYARIRLRGRYGGEAVPAEGPIPAHLLGSHEADDWSALEPLMRPVDNASTLDFHGQCKQQNVAADKLKQAASQLYWGLGLNQTSQTELILSRLNVASPNADSVLFLPRVLDGCHGGERTAVGIYPTNTTLSDYIELIELFATMQQYKERSKSLTVDNLGFPYKDRLGYNAYGVDLAIGGARALSAISPEGLRQRLGFQIFDTSEGAEMNFQMAQALKLLPRIAASMAAVRWQSDVMTGAISEGQYNDKWWEYKREYQGVSPPEERTAEQFDAFADGTITIPNYHLRRLLGGITMFSVHKYHCTLYKGASKPISECALLEDKKLGENIRTVLVSGNSKPLKDQLQAVTGQRELSADALVERLQPLADWLVQYNEQHGEEGGGVGESTTTVAIIVGVVIAVIVLGLVVFFIVSRRKQKYATYKGAPTRESQAPQNA